MQHTRLVKVLRLQHMRILDQLRLEEAIYKRDPSSTWLLFNRGTTPSAVLGMSGDPQRDLYPHNLSRQPSILSRLKCK